MTTLNDTFMPVGTIAKVRDRKPAEYLGEVAAFGVHYCQLGGVADNLLFGSGRAERVAELKETAAKLNLTITAFWVPFAGQRWGYADAPRYNGLVPEQFRTERMIRCCMASQTARELGIGILAAHVGFIPEDPQETAYKNFVSDFRYLLEFCAANDQQFILETGQENVETLERFINDLNMPNIGLNFDPANMLMYNQNEPMELLERLAKYIINVHCKDGKRPTRPATMGPETVFGQGDIDAPAIIRRLYELGYRGPLIIEREISDRAQLKIDLEFTINYLEELKKSF